MKAAYTRGGRFVIYDFIGDQQHEIGILDLTAGQPGQIYVFDPHRFEPPTRLEGQPADRANSGMCWSPDGKTLIFLSRG